MSGATTLKRARQPERIGQQRLHLHKRKPLEVPPGGATLGYDPLGRLYQTSTGIPTSTTRFLYDGVDMIREYDTANALKRRYVHGPGDDQPLVWYEGAVLTDKRYLSADERGSLLVINAYDEYGIPAATNMGRFRYMPLAVAINDNIAVPQLLYFQNLLNIRYIIELL